MTENSVDQVARDAASHSLAAIEKHEAVCAERWNQSKEALEALRRGVEGLYGKFTELQGKFVGVQITQATASGKWAGIAKAIGALIAAATVGAAIAQIVSAIVRH